MSLRNPVRRKRISFLRFVTTQRRKSIRYGPANRPRRIGVAQPAAVRATPEQIERAYRDAYMAFERRISLLLCLPLESLGQLAIKKEVDRTRMNPSLGRRWIAEFLGTALLVAVVVGSGIMAERLSSGNAAFALLANTIATGAHSWR